MSQAVGIPFCINIILSIKTKELYEWHNYITLTDVEQDIRLIKAGQIGAKLSAEGNCYEGNVGWMKRLNI